MLNAVVVREREIRGMGSAQCVGLTVHALLRVPPKSVIALSAGG